MPTLLSDKTNDMSKFRDSASRTSQELLRSAGFGSATRHGTGKSLEIRVIGQGTELLSLLLRLDDLFKRSATTWQQMYRETFVQLKRSVCRWLGGFWCCIELEFGSLLLVYKEGSA